MVLGSTAPRLRTGLVVLLFALTWSAQGASAAIVPDPSFGGNGIVTTPIGSNPGDEDVALAMALQPDGKIVAVGGFNEDEFSLARYNTNGTLDSTFGTGGKVTTDLSGHDPNIGTDEAHAVAIQPDGKIVAAGFAGAFPNSGGNYGNFGVARYNPDGSLDTTFGTGGMVITAVGDFGGPGFALALQTDGKIVVGGRASTSDPDTAEDFALARYNADGSLDTTFGGEGTVMTDVGGISADDQVNAIAVQSNGKIVAAGYADASQNNGFSSDFALARYNADGSLDTSFGGDGKVTTPISTHPNPFNDDEANALLIQPDGKLVAAGSSQVTPDDRFALARYRPDGTLDAGFGTGGKVTTAIGSITSVAHGIALQGDGKLVAAGRSADCSTGQCHQNFGSARYATNGSLDPSYGGKGKIITPVAPGAQTDVAQAVAVQSDGKIVLGGYSDMGPSQYYDYDLALVRYRFVKDSTAPETTITRHPGKRTRKHRATFGFESSEASTFKCKLDARPFARCDPPRTYRNLGPGKHRFQVKATDVSGNTDPTPATYRWEVLRNG
jgi:uncharacterized delta-60 repeat protein